VGLHCGEISAPTSRTSTPWSARWRARPAR